MQGAITGKIGFWQRAKILFQDTILIEKVNKILGTEYETIDDLHKYMKNNKTECAIKIFDTKEELVFPDYILASI